jgi:hypothetical protein
LTNLTKERGTKRGASEANLEDSDRQVKIPIRSATILIDDEGMPISVSASISSKPKPKLTGTGTSLGTVTGTGSMTTKSVVKIPTVVGSTGTGTGTTSSSSTSSGMGKSGEKVKVPSPITEDTPTAAYPMLAPKDTVLQLLRKLKKYGDIKRMSAVDFTSVCELFSSESKDRNDEAKRIAKNNFLGVYSVNSTAKLKSSDILCKVLKVTDTNVKVEFDSSVKFGKAKGAKVHLLPFSYFDLEYSVE